MADKQNCIDPIEKDPSPAVVKREQEKRVKYAVLLTIARKQIVEQKRLLPPTLCPFVLTDNGEFGSAADALQDAIVEAYRRRPYYGMDGVSTTQRTTAFRLKFRCEIAMALAAGLGAMACAAGAPWGHVTELIARGEFNLPL